MVIPKGQYIKQDINFLEYPLWFQNLRHDGLGFIWSDREGYEYRSGYRPPDKVDILILLYFLYLSQNRDYEEKIICSRHEVLKSCGLPINSQYYDRLKDSFRIWSSVSIHFEGTFYDGGNYISKDFHIMKGEINKDNNHVEVQLDSDWLLKIKESRYFKRINFGLYKALRRPVSRRLREILCKSFISRDKWPIRLTKLGTKLPIYGRETKNGTVIYASDVLVAIKPAINEINKLSRDPDIIKKTGIKPKDLFIITYEIKGTKQDRVIIFERHPVIHEEPQAKSPQRDETLEPLFIMLKKRTDKLENVITTYYQSHGCEYVKWNILYANKHAKKNYSTYLQKALAENWAEEWAQEERERIELEQKRIEEERRKAEEERQKELERQQAEKEKPLFLEKIVQIDNSVKCELWELAEKNVAPEAIRRENLVKIHYLNFLWQHLAEEGESFSKAILDDLPLVFKLERPETGS